MTANYKIVEGNEDGHFRLTVTPNPSGEAPFLNLETTGKLDREAIATYRLNISAQDGGNPPKLGYLIVNIILLDINVSFKLTNAKLACIKVVCLLLFSCLI